MMQIELLVFAEHLQASSLLQSFAKMAQDNLLEGEEQEMAGYCAPVLLPGIGSLPAHRGVRWVDMDSEEAIDEWVEDHADTLPFLVIMRYEDPALSDRPLLAWAAVPGAKPHTVNDIPPEAWQARMGSVDTPDMPLLEAVAPLLLAHEELAHLRACVDTQVLDQATLIPTQHRPGPRI